MCLIAYCPTRILEESEIDNGFKKNEDGAGYSYLKDGVIYFKKGFMKLDEFKTEYFSKDIKSPHIVHFRKTSSRANPLLTHPFILSTESPIVMEYSGDESILFHNGTMVRWQETMLQFYIARPELRIPKGFFNDTRFIAILASQIGPAALNLLDDKFAVMTSKGVKLFGNFQEERGVFFSNSSFSDTGYSYSARSGYGGQFNNVQDYLGM